MEEQEVWRWVEERKWAYRGEYSLQGSAVEGSLMISIRLRCIVPRKYPYYRSFPVDLQPGRSGHVVSALILSLLTT